MAGSEDIESAMQAMVLTIPAHSQEEQRSKIIEWLSPLNHTRQNDAYRHYKKGTRDSILSSPEFTKWIGGRSPVLWCRGIRKVFVFKTKLFSWLRQNYSCVPSHSLRNNFVRSVIVNHLISTFGDDDSVGYAYIYCNYKESQTLESLLGSLLQQIIRKRQGSLSDVIRNLYLHYRRIGVRPSIQEYSEILSAELLSFNNVYVVIDALDELQSDWIRQQLLSVLRMQPSTLRLLITSRPHIVDMLSMFEHVRVLEVRSSNEDLRMFVEQRIEHGQLKRIVDRNPTLKSRIVDTILQKADGVYVTFLLVLYGLPTGSSSLNYIFGRSHPNALHQLL